jgi:hypothetical protein
MDGTPQAIIADCVEPLRQDLRPTASDELVGGSGHGSPALVLGVLTAEAPLTIGDGEPPGVGQREPMDRAAQLIKHLFRALHGGLAVDHPACGPDRLGQG